jgi:hypothetical protein
MFYPHMDMKHDWNATSSISPIYHTDFAATYNREDKCSKFLRNFVNHTPIYRASNIINSHHHHHHLCKGLNFRTLQDKSNKMG